MAAPRSSKHQPLEEIASVKARDTALYLIPAPAPLARQFGTIRGTARGEALISLDVRADPVLLHLGHGGATLRLPTTWARTLHDALGRMLEEYDVIEEAESSHPDPEDYHQWGDIYRPQQDEVTRTDHEIPAPGIAAPVSHWPARAMVTYDTAAGEASIKFNHLRALCVHQGEGLAARGEVCILENSPWLRRCYYNIAEDDVLRLPTAPKLSHFIIGFDDYYVEAAAVNFVVTAGDGRK